MSSLSIWDLLLFIHRGEWMNGNWKCVIPQSQIDRRNTSNLDGLHTKESKEILDSSLQGVHIDSTRLLRNILCAVPAKSILPQACSILYINQIRRIYFASVGVLSQNIIDAIYELFYSSWEREWINDKHYILHSYTKNITYTSRRGPFIISVFSIEIPRVDHKIHLFKYKYLKYVFKYIFCILYFVFELRE